MSTNASSAQLDRNVFGANDGIAIDLSTTTSPAGDGVTANDATPPACGTAFGTGNLGLDVPIIDDVELTATLKVTGRACANAVVQLYRAVADGDGSDTVGGVDRGEGTEFLASTTADAAGNWTISGVGGLTGGDAVSAVTLSSQRTSEFAANVVLPITMTVNSTGDAGDVSPGDGTCITGGLNSDGDPECTLRAAIEEANMSGGHDLIDFAIPTSDPGYSASPLSFRLTPGSPYPLITDPVEIDASTQPGWTGTPIVELIGTGATGATAGLALRTDDSLIRGFIVHSFPDEGLEIDGSTGAGDRNTLSNNWVGFDAKLSPRPNAEVGILVSVDADDNVVGGTGISDGNVVGHGAVSGIVIRTNSTGNVVIGNRVGVGPDGTTADAQRRRRCRDHRHRGIEPHRRRRRRRGQHDRREHRRRHHAHRHGGVEQRDRGQRRARATAGSVSISATTASPPTTPATPTPDPTTASTRPSSRRRPSPVAS